MILWNLATDPFFKPHTDNGGCSMCQGAITIAGDIIERYVIGHASKFVPDGSVRIGSTDSAELPNVAFITPDSKAVVMVANPGKNIRRFNLVAGGRSAQAELHSGAVATYLW